MAEQAALLYLAGYDDVSRVTQSRQLWIMTVIALRVLRIHMRLEAAELTNPQLNNRKEFSHMYNVALLFIVFVSSLIRDRSSWYLIDNRNKYSPRIDIN